MLQVSMDYGWSNDRRGHFGGDSGPLLVVSVTQYVWVEIWLFSEY